MSKIQVDAIEQQTACGTTLTAGGGAGKTVVVDATTVTLGRCGGTVALASGASQTGFGRTGTVDWNTTPKTTGTFTAVSGDGFFLNTSGGVITANLPAGVAGAIVSFADYAGTWQTNNVTVVPNGTDKIGSENENATLNVEGQSVTFVFVDSTQGWINTMDSTSNVRGSPPFIVASVTGSCNTLLNSPCGNFKIATFKGPGNFIVSCAGGFSCNQVDYVVVAGGGGGCKGTQSGGGGGGGGFRSFLNTTVSPSPTSPALPLNNFPSGTAIAVSAQSYPIVVGGGGGVGSNGSVSSFDSITSAGGGGGGGTADPGNPGGSGGGGGSTTDNNFYPGGTGNIPSVSPAQGTTGGAGRHRPGLSEGAGGGGGALVGGTIGDIPGDPTTGGPGGAGAGFAGMFGTGNGQCSSSIQYFAGGGGGGGNTAGSGGLGGGGNAGRQTSNGVQAGTANTGGGGGGNYNPFVGLGGGSGIVIIRYKFQ